jgi:hypothetical protein
VSRKIFIDFNYKGYLLVLIVLFIAAFSTLYFRSLYLKGESLFALIPTVMCFLAFCVSIFALFRMATLRYFLIIDKDKKELLLNAPLLSCRASLNDGEVVAYKPRLLQLSQRKWYYLSHDKKTKITIDGFFFKGDLIKILEKM